MAKTTLDLLTCILLGLFLLSGCAGYGQARFMGRDQGRETLQQLLADFQNYHCYYTGLSLAYPAGLIFDPKQDGRSVAQKKWSKVEDQDLARKLVQNLQRYHNYPPKLYALQGEDGKHYGYIYTGYKHIVVRQLEEDRIHVLEMFEPPHLKYDQNGAVYDPE